jgi:hypothetical protein
MARGASVTIAIGATTTGVTTTGAITTAIIAIIDQSEMKRIRRPVGA